MMPVFQTPCYASRLTRYATLMLSAFFEVPEPGTAKYYRAFA